jgi:hypothetical protein
MYKTLYIAIYGSPGLQFSLSQETKSELSIGPFAITTLPGSLLGSEIKENKKYLLQQILGRMHKYVIFKFSIQKEMITNTKIMKLETSG